MDYKERAERIFERLGSLHENIEDEKAIQYRTLSNSITALEGQLVDAASRKEERFRTLLSKLAKVEEALQLQKKNFEKAEEQFNRNFQTVEKSVKRSLDLYKQEKQESEKRINLTINSLSDGFIQEGIRQQQKAALPHFDDALGEEILRLKASLTDEVAKRKASQERILEEFLEHMKFMREEQAKERREREAKDEELVVALRTLTASVKEGVNQLRKERERNEECLFKLVQSIVNKLRKQITEPVCL